MNFLTPTVILVILLLLITVGLWLQFALLRTRMSNRLGRLEERLGENEQVLDLQLKRLGEVKDQNDLLIEGTNAAKIIMEALHRDVNRLADGVRGEVGMSKAIELKSRYTRAHKDSTNQLRFCQIIFIAYAQVWSQNKNIADCSPKHDDIMLKNNIVLEYTSYNALNKNAW